MWPIDWPRSDRWNTDCIGEVVQGENDMKRLLQRRIVTGLILVGTGLCFAGAPQVWSDPPGVLTGHTDAAYGLDFSPDGSLLAVGSYDNTVSLWSVAEKRRLATLAGHADQVFRVAFSPDGDQLASASGDGTVAIWDVKTFQQVAALAGQGPPLIDVAFSPDGDRVATAGAQVELWRDGRRLWATAGRRHYFSLAWSPDGKTLAAGRRGTIELYQVSAQEQPAPNLKVELSTGAGMIYDLAFSPDGTRLASACSDGHATLWRVDDWTRAAQVQADKYALFAVEFAADGRRLFSGGRERVLAAWTVPELTASGQRYGPEETILSVAASPTDDHLAVGTYEGKVHLWRTPPPTGRSEAGLAD
jgi:WD40 repeat protein